MNKLNEKKEYNNLLFFHGVCMDKQDEQTVINDLELTVDEIGGAFSKFSRYCVVGKFNYDDKVLELGLSMIEFPYPYVRKKAREVATEKLNTKSDFSMSIHFTDLKDLLDYSLGNEIIVFNELNKIIKGFRRGSLMNFFINNKIEKLVI